MTPGPTASTWDTLTVSHRLIGGHSRDRYRVEFTPHGDGVLMASVHARTPEQAAWAKRLRKGASGAIGRGSRYSRLNVSGSMVRPSPRSYATVPVCRDGVVGCDVEHANLGNTHRVPS